MKTQYAYIKRKMELGVLSNPYELQEKDLGWFICPDFGRVQKSDVGRLLFLGKGFMQMESTEQAKKRKLGAGLNEAGRHFLGLDK